MHVGDYFFPAIVEKVDGVTSEIDWISSEVVTNRSSIRDLPSAPSELLAEQGGKEPTARSS